MSREKTEAASPSVVSERSISGQLTLGGTSAAPFVPLNKLLQLTIVIVGDEDGLLLGLVGKKRENRAEHLLLVDAHSASNTLQEKRLHDVAFDLGGSSGNLGSLAESVVDNLLDALGRGLGEETTEGSLVVGVARGAETGHVGLEDGKELLGDRLVNN